MGRLPKVTGAREMPIGEMKAYDPDELHELRTKKFDADDPEHHFKLYIALIRLILTVDARNRAIDILKDERSKIVTPEQREANLLAAEAVHAHRFLTRLGVARKILEPGTLNLDPPAMPIDGRIGVLVTLQRQQMMERDEELTTLKRQVRAARKAGFRDAVKEASHGEAEGGEDLEGARDARLRSHSLE